MFQYFKLPFISVVTFQYRITFVSARCLCKRSKSYFLKHIVQISSLAYRASIQQKCSRFTPYYGCISFTIPSSARLNAYFELIKKHGLDVMVWLSWLQIMGTPSVKKGLKLASQIKTKTQCFVVVHLPMF